MVDLIGGASGGPDLEVPWAACTSATSLSAATPTSWTRPTSGASPGYGGGMATIDLTSENFASTVEDNDVVLVDFWASWCGPCRQFAPTYEAASEANPDLAFGSVNTEEQHELAGAFAVRSIPTLMVFREGVRVFSQAGALPPQSLDQLIAAVRELDMDVVRRQLAAEQA